MEPACQVAIVPTPGLGHLIPLLELAKRLVVHHNFTVTFLIPNDGTNLTPQKKVLEVLESISSTFLPPVNFDDLPPESKVETKIALTLARSLSAVRASVKALAESARLVALVVDLFGPEAFDVAIEFNVVGIYSAKVHFIYARIFGLSLACLFEMKTCGMLLRMDGSSARILKPRKQWTDEEVRDRNCDFKARNSLYTALSKKERVRISHCDMAKQAWDLLQVTYEGNKKVRGQKLQRLVLEFENMQMGEDESIDDFHARLMYVTKDDTLDEETNVKCKQLYHASKIVLRKNYTLEKEIDSLREEKEKIELQFETSVKEWNVERTNLVDKIKVLQDEVKSEVGDKEHVSNVLPYLFFPTSAMDLWFVFELPKLDETTTCEYRDLPEPVQYSGCVPLHGRDLADPVQDRSNDAYKALLRISKRYKSAAGIMVNSFADLEPGAFKAFKEQGPGLGLPPVYPVGPVTRTGSADELGGENKCLSWLDRQLKGSVLFVSFGSGGTLTTEQMNELALGHEMSRVKFLWVSRSPNEKQNATFFGARGSNDPLSFLPEGFLERTKDVGLVVTCWAPQVQILSHRLTGGFLTHCGWNSTLESIVHGVPLIAWPLYAEQKMNAVLLAEDLKVAWRVKVNEKGIVQCQEISKYAEGLIEGDEGRVLKKKMMELKEPSIIFYFTSLFSPYLPFAHISSLYQYIAV
ncbi:hydroquinone glucosyltransferase-like [Rosa rugosa]|uniref:hydroquinone glucosyltransferase-like n=1 Tax=Rosa rugosa TaxID=74645 RepID=UPI002B417E00|nr:hydroquinone glucosyltransferase-like [Rosa rugosa]